MATAKDISVGVLSYRTHETLGASVATHLRAGLPEAVGEYFIYFNSITDEDRALARGLSLPYYGNESNSGIYGGFRAIAERASQPYVLVLENDISAVADPETTAGCLTSAAADMAAHGIPVFSMRSRTNPGQGNSGIRKLIRSHGVVQPLTGAYPAQKPTIADIVRMRLRHGTLDRFRGSAVFVECHPERAHPMAWRMLASGNYVTSSRYRNWSNQCALFDRRFFFDVVCRRVDEHPDPRLVNGFQDIERALNRAWWRRLDLPMGHSGTGIFSHARLEGDATPTDAKTA